jgi:hypothetical protein
MQSSPRIPSPWLKVCSKTTQTSIARINKEKGTPKHYDVTGASGKNNRHFFCGDCGSSLYTKLDVIPGKVIIKAGGLDEGRQKLDGKVAVEFYCRDRVPYIGAVADAKQEPLFG